MLSLEKPVLNLKQVLLFTTVFKTADIISTAIMVSRHGWDMELNVLIGLMNSPLGKHLMLWLTLPIGISLSFLMFRSKFWHPMLEWWLATLMIIPVANMIQINALWYFVASFSVVVIVRLTFIDFRKRGLNAFLSTNLDDYIEPIFLRFEE